MSQRFVKNLQNSRKCRRFDGVYSGKKQAEMIKKSLIAGKWNSVSKTVCRVTKYESDEKIKEEKNKEEEGIRQPRNKSFDSRGKSNIRSAPLSLFQKYQIFNDKKEERRNYSRWQWRQCTFARVFSRGHGIFSSVAPHIRCNMWVQFDIPFFFHFVKTPPNLIVRLYRIYS